MTDPVDSVKTSVITYENFTEFQHRLHSPTTDDEIIPSKFFSEIRKTSRSTHVPCPLTRTSESNLDVYTATSKFDYLMYTYLATTLPTVRIKKDRRDRVEICWTRNVFHNMIRHGSLRFDGDTGAEIPGGWLDIHAQFFMKNGARFPQHYDYMIGNVHCLVNWSTFLPKFNITSPQPWYYSENISHAIPLFLCSMNGVTHVYNFRLDLKDLLKMRAKVNGEWHNIKYDASHIVSNTPTISTPVMIGRYAKISPAEIAWHKEISHEVVATTVMHFGTNNPSATGDDVPIKIHTNTPVRALFFVAECQLARELNNRSNYTTNPHDSTRGFNPIRRVTHTYNSQPALVQKDYQANRVEPWYHALSAPGEMGYNMHSHSYHPGSLSADVGLTYTQKLGAELYFYIDSSNPLDNNLIIEGENNKEIIDDILEEAVHRSSDKVVGKDKHYYLHTYTLTCNIISFTNDKERNVKIDNGSLDQPLTNSNSPGGLSSI